MCKREARCSGDNSYVDECIDSAKEGRDDAADAGCKREYNKFAKCIDNHASCNDGMLELDSFDACDDAIGEFTNCYLGF